MGTGPLVDLNPMPPRYGQASLSDVLPGVLAALGVPGEPDPLGLSADLVGVRRVAVLLVDGLGYRQLGVAAPGAPVLADVAAGRLGRLREITCGFPSTTPTSLVSLGTGAAPGAHGVLGFTVNVPGTARLLTHIDWLGDPDPRLWQPVPTVFERASAAGITATAVARLEFAGSSLTTAAYGGAGYRGVADVDALVTQVLAALAQPAPCLVYGYFGAVDAAGHLAGVGSPQWRDATAAADRLIDRLVAGLPADGALLVTADHGQIVVPAADRFDIDSDPRLAAGVRIVAGEARVRYLHVQPGATDDVLAAWRAVLGPAAWVVPRAEAVAAGWFGPVPEGHLARVGDVVVACRGTHVVLSTARERPSTARMVGFHGSFTAEEMSVPLVVLRPPGR